MEKKMTAKNTYCSSYISDFQLFLYIQGINHYFYWFLCCLCVCVSQINISMKSKQKQKKHQSKQSKKRQLLSVFRPNVALLQLLTPDELDSLENRIQIFVFTRGQCLAKEGETVDYVGVIAEGRAIGKGVPFQVGDTIGHAAVLGYEDKHPKTITGESDGVIVVLRIIDLLAIDRPALKNRILGHLCEVYAGQLAKREELSRSFEQLQTVQQKKISKILTPEWVIFLSQMDPKEKAKFMSFFPFYRIKQKDLVSNTTLKPSLVYVVEGQLIAKNKHEQRVVQSGTVYNLEGFIFGQTPQENVYCLSTNATVLLVDKAIIENSFKFQTCRSLMRLLLGQWSVLHKKPTEEQEGKEGREGKSWSMFRKYPNTEILPLPKKTDSGKAALKTQASKPQGPNLIPFQTLFRQQLGTATKQKTISSLAQSGYDKLYTLKTQSAGKEVQATLQLQKLRKEVQLLGEKLRFSEQVGKASKLQLIQNKSKVNMAAVLKQISKLRQQDEVIRPNGQKQQELQSGDNCITLKQALDKQLRSNKVQMLVAKCAFRWLYLTRKHRPIRQ